MIKSPVNREIYVAVAKAVSPEFAFSYLGVAAQHGRVITPHTHVAWERLRDSFAARKVFEGYRVILQEPTPYYPGRDEEEQQRDAA